MRITASSTCFLHGGYSTLGEVTRCRRGPRHDPSRPPLPPAPPLPRPDPLLTRRQESKRQEALQVAREIANARRRLNTAMKAQKDEKIVAAYRLRLNELLQAREHGPETV